MKPSLAKTLQYVALYVISLLLIGVTSALTGSRPYLFWQDRSWYLDNLLTYAAIICVTMATMLMVNDKKRRTNEEYVAGEQEISTFGRTEYRPSIFNRYANHTNRERKIDQYKADMNVKISKLELKASLEDEAIRMNGTAKEKEANAYCRRHQVLDDQLEEEYIQSHIDKINVDYDMITADVVFGMSPKKMKRQKVNPYVTKGKTGRIIKDKAPMLLISFGFVCLTSSILIDLEYNADFWMNIGVKVLSLLWNTIQTVDYAATIFMLYDMNDMRFRVGIIKEERIWVKNKVEEANKNDGRRNSPTADAVGPAIGSNSNVGTQNHDEKGPVHLHAEAV